LLTVNCCGCQVIAAEGEQKAARALEERVAGDVTASPCAGSRPCRVVLVNCCGCQVIAAEGEQKAARALKRANRG